MAKQRKDEQKVDRRGLLDARKKEEMLAILIRNQEAFDAVSETLKVEHIRAFSEPLALVWSVVVDYYKDFGKPPRRSLLEAEIHNRVNENPGLLVDDTEREEVDDFIDFAYDDKQHGKSMPTSSEHVRWALRTCRLLLEEQIALETQEELQVASTVPKDMPAVMERHAARMAIVQSIEAPPSEDVFPEGWDSEPEAVPISTGVEPYDKMTGGGPAGGEVHLFMAPYGVCKTTLGTIVTDNMAVRCVELAAKQNDGRCPVTIIVSSETPIREFRERILVYGAKIPRRRIRAYMQHRMEWSDFSKASKPGATRETEYELHLMKNWARFREEWMPEQERLRHVIKRANKHIMFVDFTSSNKQHKNIGMGGMRELANVIAGELRRKPGHYPINLVVDHIAAMGDRMLDSGQYRKEDLTGILQKMPLQCRDLLAIRYNIPALLFHQLSGQANMKRAPGAELTYSDAAGCKSIGMYCDFSVICGFPTVEPDKLQVAKWKCDKHRREPPKPVMLVGIDGTYHRLTDETNHYTIHGNQIVESVTTVRDSGHDLNVQSAYDLSGDNKKSRNMRSGVRP